jgi:PKD repeat protein
MWKKLGVVVLLVVMLIMIASCNGNKKPTALFSVDVLQGKSPLTVNFNGAISTDEDGEIVAHEWDFDDSETAEGPQVTHTFTSQDDRVFDVRLTVTDDQGGRASTSTNIHVEGSAASMGNVLFFDDFEDGLDPAWHTQTHWYIHDGWLTCQFGRRYAYVLDGSHWHNYAVDVDVNSQAGQAGVLLRCSEDLQDFVVFRGSHSALGFKVYRAGKLESTSNEISPGFFVGSQHLRIEVNGNTYKAFVEGHLRSEFVYEGIQSGMPGLEGGSAYSCPENTPRFDNYRVTQLQ